MRSIIKSLLAATAGLVLSVAPAHARVEANTDELLNLLNTTGVSVTINDPQYCNETTYGTYVFRGMQRQMNLCPGSTVDAIDHNTVRHETWHAIQHCVNTARGTAPNTPVQQDINELAEVVNTTLSSEVVNFIKANYSDDELLIEFEAFAAAELFTATELIKIYTDACTAGGL